MITYQLDGVTCECDRTPAALTLLPLLTSSQLYFTLWLISFMIHDDAMMITLSMSSDLCFPQNLTINSHGNEEIFRFVMLHANINYDYCLCCTF